MAFSIVHSSVFDARVYCLQEVLAKKGAISGNFGEIKNLLMSMLETYNYEQVRVLFPVQCTCAGFVTCS